MKKNQQRRDGEASDNRFSDRQPIANKRRAKRRLESIRP